LDAATAKALFDDPEFLEGVRAGDAELRAGRFLRFRSIAEIIAHFEAGVPPRPAALENAPSGTHTDRPLGDLA